MTPEYKVNIFKYWFHKNERKLRKEYRTLARQKTPTYPFMEWCIHKYKKEKNNLPKLQRHLFGYNVSKDLEGE